MKMLWIWIIIVNAVIKWSILLFYDLDWEWKSVIPNRMHYLEVYYMLVLFMPRLLLTAFNFLKLVNVNFKTNKLNGKFSKNTFLVLWPLFWIMFFKRLLMDIFLDSAETSLKFKTHFRRERERDRGAIWIGICEFPFICCCSNLQRYLLTKKDIYWRCKRQNRQ